MRISNFGLRMDLWNRESHESARIAWSETKRGWYTEDTKGTKKGTGVAARKRKRDKGGRLLWIGDCGWLKASC